MNGVTHSYLFKERLLKCEPIDLGRFGVDLRERHLDYWTLKLLASRHYLSSDLSAYGFGLGLQAIWASAKPLLLADTATSMYSM